MTILATAGQHTILMSSLFCFCSKFHMNQKKLNPQTNQGLYITHPKGLLEVSYFHLPL